MDWKLHPPGAHFQTPGLLGLSPPGKPLSLREHTDTLSQLLTPGPVGHNPWNEKVAREAFYRALLTAQINAREGKKPIWGLPDTELKKVTNDKYMHKDVAPLFNKMWDEIEKDFKARKGAAKGDSIGVASAYRSAADDNKAWHNAVGSIYLGATRAKRLRTGEAFGYGPKSVDIMFKYMNGLKAPAGYSGHTHGIAADLITRENGQLWRVISQYEHQLGWQGTWLYKWLVANAGKHKFYQLRTETWHWEYHAGKVPVTCYEANVPIEGGGRKVKMRR